MAKNQNYCQWRISPGKVLQNAGDFLRFEERAPVWSGESGDRWDIRLMQYCPRPHVRSLSVWGHPYSPTLITRYRNFLKSFRCFWLLSPQIAQNTSKYCDWIFNPCPQHSPRAHIKHKQFIKNLIVGVGNPDDWWTQDCPPQDCPPVGNPEVGNPDIHRYDLINIIYIKNLHCRADRLSHHKLTEQKQNNNKNKN